MNGKYLIKAIKLFSFACMIFLILNIIFAVIFKYDFSKDPIGDRLMSYTLIAYDSLFHFLRISFYLGFAYLLEFLLEKKDEKI